jgi:TetR/AcrR family transcriptional repressor of nem operon
VSTLSTAAGTAGSDDAAVEAGGRGRPREFDEGEVLDQVLDVFWTRGYEATSIADIVEATGLNKSSLYNSFGSKEELFAAAAERYVDFRGAMMRDVILDGTRGVDDVAMLVDLQEGEMLSARGRLGCLAVNTATERGFDNETAQQLARRFRDEIRASVGAAFGRAEAMGEIAPGNASNYTEIVLAFTMSLGVISRGASSDDELTAQFAAMRALLASWRV